MNKRLIAFLSVLSLSLSVPLLPANAVWNGITNFEDQRTVPILFDYDRVNCASGFLYSPRIVFTVAHNLFVENDLEKEHVTRRNLLWVGYPNDTLNRGVRRVIVEKSFVPNGYKSRTAWTGGDRITRINDFAVLVLKSPLPAVSKPVELLTPELHDQYIQSNEQINLTGYGTQLPEQAGRECLNRKPSSFQSTITGKTISTGNVSWTTTLNTKVAPGMPNMCDGDSGAGHTKLLSDKYIYLGAAGAGGFLNHNCAAYEPWLNEESITGADPVYLFTDLIAQAEKYVADNPYIEPKSKTAGFNNKITITCIKGKTKKKVTAIAPKCPAGYKKK
jgi:hypothetical protein